MALHLTATQRQENERCQVSLRANNDLESHAISSFLVPFVYFPSFWTPLLYAESHNPVHLDLHSPGAIRAARGASTKEDAHHRKRVYAMAEAKAKQQAMADPFIKEFLSTQMFAKFIADRTFPSKGNGRAADGVMHDTGGIDFRIVFFDACLDAIRVEKRHERKMEGTDFAIRKPSPMARADSSGLGKSLSTGTNSGAKSLDLMRSFRIRMGQHADLLVDRVQGHEGGRLNILLNTTSNPIPDSPGLKRRRKQLSKDFRSRRGSSMSMGIGASSLLHVVSKPDASGLENCARTVADQAVHDGIWPELDSSLYLDPVALDGAGKETGQKTQSWKKKKKKAKRRIGASGVESETAAPSVDDISPLLLVRTYDEHEGSLVSERAFRGSLNEGGKIKLAVEHARSYARHIYGAWALCVPSMIVSALERGGEVTKKRGGEKGTNSKEQGEDDEEDEIAEPTAIQSAEAYLLLQRCLRCIYDLAEGIPAERPNSLRTIAVAAAFAARVKGRVAAKKKKKMEEDGAKEDENSGAVPPPPPGPPPPPSRSPPKIKTGSSERGRKDNASSIAKKAAAAVDTPYSVADEACYRALLIACYLGRSASGALNVFSEIRRAGIMPNAVTFSQYTRAAQQSRVAHDLRASPSTIEATVSEDADLWKREYHSIIMCSEMRCSNSECPAFKCAIRDEDILAGWDCGKDDELHSRW